MTYKVIDVWEEYYGETNKLYISQSKYDKNNDLLWLLMDFHLYDLRVKVLLCYIYWLVLNYADCIWIQGSE